MATPRPWTADDTATLHTLHGEGKSLTAIAKEMGRSKAMVSRYAEKANLTWDRTKTQAATKAHQADAASRRAALQVGLLDDIEKLRGELFAPCTVHSFGGRDNTYAEHHVEQPPFADQLKIMQAVGAAIDRHVRLAEHDAGAGTGQVVGLLQQTAAALGITDGAQP